MATKLWKNGKAEWVETEYVGLRLKQGWSVTNEPVLEKPKPKAKTKVKD